MTDVPRQTSDQAAPRPARALPALGRVMVGATLWAVLMGLSAWYGVSALDWETRGRITSIILLFAAGAFFAFPLGILVARLLTGRGGREVAFAAAFLSLAVATIGITSLIFAFDYRTYYAEWHDDELSIRLVFEVVFTTLSAVYQFAVLGVRLYFPVGFLGLFVASWWFARQRN